MTTLFAGAVPTLRLTRAVSVVRSAAASGAVFARVQESQVLRVISTENGAVHGTIFFPNNVLACGASGTTRGVFRLRSEQKRSEVVTTVTPGATLAIESIMRRSLGRAGGKGGIEDGGAEPRHFPLQRFNPCSESADDVIQIANDLVLIGDAFFEFDKAAHALEANAHCSSLTAVGWWECGHSNGQGAAR